LLFADPTRIDALLRETGTAAVRRRVIDSQTQLSRDRAPKLTVNGSLATLLALQRLGECWIDFHGPSEPRRLLKESGQLELLDLFGRAGPVLKGYQEKYLAWRECVEEKEKITSESRLSAEQVDFLQNQIAKIEAAGADRGSDRNPGTRFCPDESSAGTDGIGGASHGGLNGEEGLQGRIRGFAAGCQATRGD